VLIEIPRSDCDRRTVDVKPNAAFIASGARRVIPFVWRRETSQPSWSRLETMRKIQLHTAIFWTGAVLLF
jgi:hypothetical protein